MKAESNSQASTMGYVIHYVYSVTSTLLPQYIEPVKSDDVDEIMMSSPVEGTGIWLLLPSNPVLFTVVLLVLTMTTCIGLCILCTFHRALWYTPVVSNMPLRFVYFVYPPSSTMNTPVVSNQWLQFRRRAPAPRQYSL